MLSGGSNNLWAVQQIHTGDITSPQEEMRNAQFEGGIPCALWEQFRITISRERVCREAFMNDPGILGAVHLDTTPSAVFRTQPVRLRRVASP
jgi:hypothetical protein